MRRFFLSIVLLVLLSACTAVPPAPRKIALLAPFEGQYREIGYEALYAAQLALQGNKSILILPLDDGGTEATARERARALTYDSSIVFVLALGPYATTPEVQAAYGDLPVLMVGYWPSIPQHENIAALSADLRDVLPSLSDPGLYTGEGLIGAELLSLPQFDQREGCTVWSSAQWADESFAARYDAMNPFAPPPRLIAPLTFEAIKVTLAALETHMPLRQVDIPGQEQRLAFNEAGYWREAEVYQYGCGNNR